MDRIYKRGRATAEDVRADLNREVSNSTVRTMLSILEAKACLRHEVEGKRFVYLPVKPTEEAGVEALKAVLGTFFANSGSKAVAALLEASDLGLPEEEFSRLAALIETAAKGGG